MVMVMGVLFIRLKLIWLEIDLNYLSLMKNSIFPERFFRCKILELNFTFDYGISFMWWQYKIINSLIEQTTVEIGLTNWKEIPAIYTASFCLNETKITIEVACRIQLKIQVVYIERQVYMCGGGLQETPRKWTTSH